MLQKFILALFTFMILVSCNFDSAEDESGGGLFVNNKLIENEFLLIPIVSTTYLENQNINISLRHSANVTVTGTPRVQLTLDSGTVYADYVSGSGTKTLTFRYTVASNDTDEDGIIIDSSIDLNSGTITFINQGVSTNSELTIKEVLSSTILVDTTVPSILIVTPPEIKTYYTGDKLQFIVIYDEQVAITGTPRIELNIGGVTKYAQYLSGSDSSTIIFSYEVESDDLDLDGPTMASPIELNSGTIKDQSGNDAVLTYTPVPMPTTYIDGDTPYVTGLTTPPNETYYSGDSLSLSLNFSESVNVTGAPRVEVTIGSQTKYFNYISGSGTPSLLFQYTVEVSDEDFDGITLSTAIDLNAGTIQDSTAIDASLNLIVPLLPSVLIDAAKAQVVSIQAPTDSTYQISSELYFTANFDKDVTITGTPRIQLLLSSHSPAYLYADYISGSGSDEIVFRYQVQPGELDLDGITIENFLDLNSGAITGLNYVDAELDISTAVSSLDTSAILVDTSSDPTIISITPPADSSYSETDNLDFIVNTDENITVTGTPSIQLNIGGTTKNATYISGTGTTALTFRYTVEANLYDTDGVTAISPIELNSGTMQNATTINLELNFTPPSLVNVLVDSTAPVVSITTPADSSYINVLTDSATFIVSGTCNESGKTVSIEVDNIAASSPVNFLCDGTNFTGTIDTTGLTEATHAFTAKLVDDALNEATSTINNVTRDITIPVISSITTPTNNWYKEAQDLSFVLNFDDSVSLTGVPRILIDVNGTTRYADYVSGSGTAALTFTYSVQAAEEDTDGIGFASSLLDLNGATLVDAAANTVNLNLDASSALPVLSSILVDAIIPTVSITSSDSITAANENNYSVTGTCSENGRLVTVDIDGLSLTPFCVSGSWTTGSVDVSGLLDNLALPITADHNDIATNLATQATTDVVKDSATSQVTITASPDITSANVTAYSVSGSCTDVGVIVDVYVGTLNFQPNCSGGTWTTGYVDVSTVTDDPAVLITADHSGATQATENVGKDTVSSTVTIVSSPNINLSNETSYIASGTCSDTGTMVDIYIDSLNFQPNCSNGSWTTGSVDLSSIADGSISVTVDHSSATQVTTTINKNTTTPTVASLSVPTTLTNSCDISWNLNNPGGFTPDDYEIGYRVKGSSTWLTFSDGISTNTNTTVDNLIASTTYEFRVRLQYDTSSYTEWSNTAEGETKPDDPLFSSPYAAMNVGGSTDTKVVALLDNTRIYLNGVEIPASPIAKGVPTSLPAHARYAVIDADGPIFTAGRLGATGGSNTKGNIAWQPTSWAGKTFSFNATRETSQQLFVYATENSYVEIKQGSTVLDSATITAGNGANLTWTAHGSYQVVSTGTILAYHISADATSKIVDPKPLLPSSNEMIGFPSTSMRITTDFDATNYSLIHSNSTVASGNLDRDDSIRINPQGSPNSLYQGDSLLISADRKIAGASFADSNGYCAAPFLPTNLMKTKYMINSNADWVAFASKQSGTIDVYSPTQTIGVDTPTQTLTLNRTGANSNAPYKVRIGTTTEGYRFIANVPVAGWYQANNDSGSADEDETILYGSD